MPLQQTSATQALRRPLLTLRNAKARGVKGNTVFAVVQFEYTTWAQDGKTDMYGKLPSPIAVLTLDQDPTTGKLTLVKYHNVDTSPAMGLWITCGASLSPWNNPGKITMPQRRTWSAISAGDRRPSRVMVAGASEISAST